MQIVKVSPGSWELWIKCEKCGGVRFVREDETRQYLREYAAKAMREYGSLPAADCEECEGG